MSVCSIPGLEYEGLCSDNWDSGNVLDIVMGCVVGKGNFKGALF